MLKILVLSFYYAPDLSAGAFRTAALVEQLSRMADVHVTVMATMPNRHGSFNTAAQAVEQYDDVAIRRIALPPHRGRLFDQIKSFVIYYRHVMRLVEAEEYDLIYATSSLLLTAFLGARIARKKSLPCYLDIRDIFVDTLKDVLNTKIFYLIKPALFLLEHYTFARASHINLVSPGFSPYFIHRFKRPHYTWFPNGIDDEFLGELPPKETRMGSSAIIEILYAGNIGEGQGLHHLIPALASSLGQNYHITVIGDGRYREYLQAVSATIDNLTLLEPVRRDELRQHYANADILLLHLNDYPAFEKVLPSKLFEYAATGKPILAGVGGYAARFIGEELSGVTLFPPNDVPAATAALEEISLDRMNRGEFIKKFTRRNIMTDMAQSVVACAVENKM